MLQVESRRWLLAEHHQVTKRNRSRISRRHPNRNLRRRKCHSARRRSEIGTIARGSKKNHLRPFPYSLYRYRCRRETIGGVFSSSRVTFWNGCGDGCQISLLFRFFDEGVSSLCSIERLDCAVAEECRVYCVTGCFSIDFVLAKAADKLKITSFWNILL